MKKENKCPACNGKMETPEVRNALSRYKSVYICNKCGLKEALEGDFWTMAYRNALDKMFNNL